MQKKTKSSSEELAKKIAASMADEYVGENPPKVFAAGSEKDYFPEAQEDYRKKAMEATKRMKGYK